MTIPNSRFITITDLEQKSRQLLEDLVVRPREKAVEWARITKQTPNLRIGYPGQHLASLVTGMEGRRTGARGHDLCDGTEVKSCSRIDQLDKCGACKAGVARIETECPECGSTDIERKNDSKWLFTIKSESDLDVLTNGVPRILLILGDYPGFLEDDFSVLRFQTFEIWNGVHRHRRFVELMTGYHSNIYLEHRRKDPTKTPAPKNFWPYSFQFYMCNPVKTFEATIETSGSGSSVCINSLVDPYTDRATLRSEQMPADVLNGAEMDTIIRDAGVGALRGALSPEVASQVAGLDDASVRSHLQKLSLVAKRVALPLIGEELREHLDLRDTDRIATASTPYSRPSIP